MDIIKYDMADIWASAGDVVAPDSAKIAQGWGVEVVPRQWWNWFENRQDNNLAYMLQKGFPEWDATTEYIINKSYVQRSGIVYKATATSVNSDPIALTSWVKAFPESTISLEVLKDLIPAADRAPYYTGAGTAALMTVTAFARTLLDDPNVTTMRSTLGAQATHPNLTTLSTVSAAANQLPYFTGTNAAAVTTLTSFGRSLIDDADAAAARATLGLTAAAITDLMANQTESDISKIMKVGAFGVGSYLDLRNHILVSGAPSDAYGYGTVFGFVNGGVGGIGTALAIPGLSGVQYGTLQVNGQFPDASGLTAMSRTFIGPNGRTFSQTASSASTWGTWVESWTSGNLTKTTSNRDTTAGSMLKVGDFGLGGAVTLADAIDLNTVVDSGFYRLGANPNLPSGGAGAYGQMIVSRGADTIAQTVYSYSGPRMFTRTGNPTNIGGSGVWTSWVEYYHTGNTAQIVADVTAGIQPTLDAKLNKSGGTMTGTLTATSIELGTSSAGFIDFHSPGGHPDTDARISVDSPAAANFAGGRLVLSAGTTYVANLLTVVNVASFQNNINSSGTITGSNVTATNSVTGAYVTSTGNVNANGSFTAAGNITVSGFATFGGTVTSTSGLFASRASSAGANAHLWFYNENGTVTRGIMYATSANVVAIQAGAALCAAFQPSGQVNFNQINTTNIENNGRVRSLRNGIPVNATMYANCHYMAETQDGTPPAYAWHRGGSYALAVWMTNANELQMMDSSGSNREIINNVNLPAWMVSTYANGNQQLGGTAFARNGAGTLTFGNQVAGGNLSPGSTGLNSGSLAGTWVCLGAANGGNHTLFIRIA